MGMLSCAYTLAATLDTSIFVASHVADLYAPKCKRFFEVVMSTFHIFGRLSTLTYSCGVLLVTLLMEPLRSSWGILAYSFGVMTSADKIE